MNDIVFNATQHAGSPEQIAQGLCDLEGEDLTSLKKLLTFTGEDLRTDAQFALGYRAERICALLRSIPACRAGSQILIGGLPALQGPLAACLYKYGFRPVFAHSDRVSEDQVQADGSARKVAIFRHQFFYPAYR